MEKSIFLNQSNLDEKKVNYSASNKKLNKINVKNIDLTDYKKDTSNNSKNINKIKVDNKSKLLTKSPNLNMSKSNFESVGSSIFNNTSKVFNQNHNLNEKVYFSKEKDNLTNNLTNQPEKKIERRKAGTVVENTKKKDNEIMSFKGTQKLLITSSTVKKMTVLKGNANIQSKEKSNSLLLSENKNNNVGSSNNFNNINNFHLNLNTAMHPKCSKTVELDLNRCSSEKVIFKKINNIKLIPTVRTILYDNNPSESSHNLNTENSSDYTTFKRSIVSLSEARKNKSLTKQNTSSISEESLNNFKLVKDSVESINYKKEIDPSINIIQNIKTNNLQTKIYSLDDTSYKVLKRSSLSLDHKIMKTEGNYEINSANRRSLLDEYRTKLKIINLKKDEFSSNRVNTEL